MNRLKPKVAVIGAGSVGSTFAFALMTSGLAREIALVDVDQKRAYGESLDLSHGLMFIKPVNIHSGGYEACDDADLVVVTAGARQKPGQSRLDLAAVNTEIFRTMIPEIAARAKNAIILIVTNPVDVLTYAAIKFSRLPPGRVFGSGTVLDTGRLRYAISGHCGVDARNIHAYIIGEHGDSELPVWSGANIGGVPLTNYCAQCGSGNSCNGDNALKQIFTDVKDAAAQIIAAKGATNFAVARALVTITEAILRNENSILTVSAPVENYLGISGVCLSLPCIVNQDGVNRFLKLDLSPLEQEQLVNSATAINKVIKSLNI